MNNKEVEELLNDEDLSTFVDEIGQYSLDDKDVLQTEEDLTDLDLSYEDEKDSDQDQDSDYSEEEEYDSPEISEL